MCFSYFTLSFSAILPHTYNTPLYLTPEELQHLKGSPTLGIFSILSLSMFSQYDSFYFQHNTHVKNLMDTVILQCNMTLLNFFYFQEIPLPNIAALPGNMPTFTDSCKNILQQPNYQLRITSLLMTTGM